MKYTLTVVGDGETIRSFPLYLGENTVGRAKTNQICLGTDCVSSFQFSIAVTETGSLVLRNLTTRRTTVLESDTLEAEEERVFYPRQKILINNAVQCLVEEEEGEMESRPAPQGKLDQRSSVTMIGGKLHQASGQDRGESSSAMKTSHGSSILTTMSLQELMHRATDTRIVPAAEPMRPELETHGNGPSQRALETHGNGPSQRALETHGNVPSQRALETHGSGPAQRALETHGGEGRQAALETAGGQAKTQPEGAPTQNNFRTGYAGGQKPTQPTAGTRSDTHSEHTSGTKSPTGLGTMGGGTRQVTEEEMTRVRKLRQRQQQNRLYVRMLIWIALAIMALFLWLYHGPKKETRLSWPCKSAETAFTTTVPIDGGKIEDGGIVEVVYPACGKETLEEDNGYHVIHSYLGKNMNVPFNISVYHYRAAENLYLDADDALLAAQKWLRDRPAGQGKAQDERYDFDMTTKFEVFQQSVAHKNDENGVQIMVQRMTHVRGEEHWAGRLLFFRNGATHYMVLLEVPERNLLEAQFIFYNVCFLYFSDSFFVTRWEGSSQLKPVADMDRTLSIVEDELQRRNSPRIYAGSEVALYSVLAQCERMGFEGNGMAKDVQARAYRLLKLLRQKQEGYYHQAVIQWLDKTWTGNRPEFAAQAAAVFNPWDKRQEDIRMTWK